MRSASRWSGPISPPSSPSWSHRLRTSGYQRWSAMTEKESRFRRSDAAEMQPGPSGLSVQFEPRAKLLPSRDAADPDVPPDASLTHDLPILAASGKPHPVPERKLLEPPEVRAVTEPPVAEQASEAKAPDHAAKEGAVIGDRDAALEPSGKASRSRASAVSETVTDHVMAEIPQITVGHGASFVGSGRRMGRSYWRRLRTLFRDGLFVRHPRGAGRPRLLIHRGSSITSRISSGSNERLLGPHQGHHRPAAPADDPYQLPTLITVDLACPQPFGHRPNLGDRPPRRKPRRGKRQSATALAVVSVLGPPWTAAEASGPCGWPCPAG